jgi:hypothetical protein
MPHHLSLLWWRGTYCHVTDPLSMVWLAHHMFVSSCIWLWPMQYIRQVLKAFSLQNSTSLSSTSTLSSLHRAWGHCPVVFTTSAHLPISPASRHTQALSALQRPPLASPPLSGLTLGRVLSTHHRWNSTSDTIPAIVQGAAETVTAYPDKVLAQTPRSDQLPRGKGHLCGNLPTHLIDCDVSPQSTRLWKTCATSRPSKAVD